MRIVPVGTHDYQKFISPRDLTLLLSECEFAVSSIYSSWSWISVYPKCYDLSERITQISRLTTSVIALFWHIRLQLSTAAPLWARDIFLIHFFLSYCSVLHDETHRRYYL